MKDSVAIIAGGPSINNIDLTKVDKFFENKIIINKAIKDFPIANKNSYFITMDYTFLKKIDPKYIENFQGTKVFIANFCFDYIKEQNGRIEDTRFNLVYDLSDFDMIIKSRNKYLFRKCFKNFANGNNSGFCGIQLALLLGYKNIHLFGFDLNFDKSTHYHDGYKQDPNKFQEKLDEYYLNFKSAIQDLNHYYPINLYSCSKRSRLNDFLQYDEYFEKYFIKE